MKKSKLETLRKQKGYTQKQLADFLCMDVSNYNRREKGKTHLTAEEWKKICLFLEVNLE